MALALGAFAVGFTAPGSMSRRDLFGAVASGAAVVTFPSAALAAIDSREILQNTAGKVGFVPPKVEALNSKGSIGGVSVIGSNYQKPNLSPKIAAPELTNTASSFTKRTESTADTMNRLGLKQWNGN